MTRSGGMISRGRGVSQYEKLIVHDADDTNLDL